LRTPSGGALLASMMNPSFRFFLAILSLAPVGAAACSGSGSGSAHETLTGTFACGATTCERATQYCVHQYTDEEPGSDSYACSDVPSACAGDPTCACVLSDPMLMSLEVAACNDPNIAEGPPNGKYEPCVDGAVIVCLPDP
jgi:hypothetical protein